MARSASGGTAPPRLPPPEVYEEEYAFWPWGQLVAAARDLICERAPPHGSVLDYMCGTGFLLRQISAARSDLNLVGCDIDDKFIDYARREDSGASFVCADARVYTPDCRPNVAVCTAGLHHLAFADQKPFLRKVRDACRDDTLIVIGEAVLPPYDDEMQRRQAALALGGEVIVAGVMQRWPQRQILAAATVLANDVTLSGEYKRQVTEWRSLLSDVFIIEQEEETWKPDTGGGDVLFVCYPKR